jgi:carbamoyl-phosphate synthase large subunit
MRSIRAAAILHNIPCITTLQGAWAAIYGIEASLKEEFTVESLQSLYQSNVGV